MASLNKVIIGHLGRDPEVKHTTSGKRSAGGAGGGGMKKGPWFVRDLGLTKDGQPYCIVQAGGPDIGDGWVDDEYFSLSGIMTSETASLIAAAPDLYAALERIYGRLIMSDRDGDARITAEEGEMAEFALKKARGEL